MPIFTVPIHELREFNPCHTPGGSPVGGRFCSDRDAFVPAPRGPSPTQQLIEPYGEHGPALAAAQRQLTKRMTGDGNEHMVVLQPGEHPFYFTSGSDRFVEMPHETFMEEMRANPPIFTAHTHPTGSAPSHADLRMQVRSKTSRQIIFGDGGEWYEIEVTDLATAEKVIGEGRRKATYWEEGTKGTFQTEFDRLKASVSKESLKLTDAWAAKQYGWTVAQNPFKPKPGAARVVGSRTTKKKSNDGFLMEDGSWISRGEAGKLHPEISQYHMQRFSELSPRIWTTLAERHTWFTFRYHRETGPYATT